MTESVQVLKVDFKESCYDQPIVDLINHYMSDPMGCNYKQTNEMKQNLIDGLRNHPNVVILLAKINETFVGLMIGFENFGTFAAKKFINIHDIVVRKEFRNRNIGRLMLKFMENYARETNCSKITLEVRHDNENAKHLYNSEGYVDDTPPMYFWTKKL